MEVLFIWRALQDFHRSQKFKVYLYLEGVKLEAKKMVGATKGL